ncbi:MAG: alpha/beta hydrolase, partial [Alphaproteobacteria bacterium]
MGRLHRAFGDDGTGGTASFDPARLSVAAIRALEEAVTRVFGFGAVPVAECRDLQIGSGPDAVPCRLYRGFGATAPAPLVIYFHGGGFISGSLDSHDGVARALANAARATVLSVGYRLAPEHPYPAALEDGLAVTLRAWHHADHFACDPKGV